MKKKIRGHGFRLVGLILGIIGAAVSVTAIVLSGVGIGLVKKSRKEH